MTVASFVAGSVLVWVVDVADVGTGALVVFDLGAQTGGEKPTLHVHSE